MPGGPQRGLDQAVVGADPTDVVSLADALADPGTDLPFSEAALARFERCAAEIRRLRRSLSEPVVDVLHRILQETGLEVEIAASSAAYRQRCAETVGAFLGVAGGFTDLEGEESVTAFRTFLKAAAAHERGLDVDLPPAESKTVKILTMHKAKGLEWEVVVVPHQYEVRPRVEKFTTSAGKLPHELRGDGEWLPELGPEPGKRAVDRFEALMKEHAEYEDRRVEYVALTRAKELLLASAHVWGPTQKEPRSANGTLTSLREYLLANYEAGRVDAWAFSPGRGEAVNPLREQQAEAEWPAPLNSAARTARLSAAAAVTALLRLPEERWPGEPEIEDARQRRIVEGWDADLDALLDELRRAHEVRFEVPMPVSLSTTRLMAFAKDPDAFAEQLFRPMPRPPAPQARRGTEFHAWVEQRFGQLSLFDDADLELFGEDEDGEDLAELKAAFLRTEYAEREPYRIEAPFQLFLAGQIVRGRIDAVYRTGGDGLGAGDGDGNGLGDGAEDRFEIVDWKTNRRQDADPLQLAVYRLAWAELQGVPLERVSAAFLYVRTGEVVRPEALPDRAALERLLAPAELRDPASAPSAGDAATRAAAQPRCSPCRRSERSAGPEKRSEPVRGGPERVALRVREHPCRRHGEELGGDLRAGVADRAVERGEAPAPVPLVRPQPDQPVEHGMVGHLRGPALDDDVEAAVPGVAAGGEHDVRVRLQVQVLLLLGAGVEVHRALAPGGHHRRHMRAPVGAHRGEPEQLRRLERAHGLLPADRHRPRVAVAGVEPGERTRVRGVRRTGHGRLLSPRRRGSDRPRWETRTGRIGPDSPRFRTFPSVVGPGASRQAPPERPSRAPGRPPSGPSDGQNAESQCATRRIPDKNDPRAGRGSTLREAAPADRPSRASGSALTTEGCPMEFKQSRKLSEVQYDLRGPVLQRAKELEAEGHSILKLNIGNPAPFGFDAPDELIARHHPQPAGLARVRRLQGPAFGPPRGGAVLPDARAAGRRHRGRLHRQRRLRADLHGAQRPARHRRRGPHPGAGLPAVDRRDGARGRTAGALPV